MVIIPLNFHGWSKDYHLHFFNKRRIVLEEQIAAVIAQAQVTNTFFAEAYYFLTIPLMLLIHVGFLSYEMGATRV